MIRTTQGFFHRFKRSFLGWAMAVVCVLPWQAQAQAQAQSSPPSQQPLQPMTEENYQKITQLMLAQEYAQALQVTDEYLKLNPRNPQLRFMRSVVHTEMGNIQQAVEELTDLTREYPELPEPYNNLAVLYARQGHYAQARDALEAALRTRPGYATAQENLGDVYVQLALQAYEKVGSSALSSASLAQKTIRLRQVLQPTADTTGSSGSAGATGSMDKTQPPPTSWVDAPASSYSSDSLGAVPSTPTTVK